ncbi:hypothetical protein DKX38_003486 [Salix brachista]|uniref:Uncharacterized protein n=1 Tax=Salix brachista TaxID=2182728 RepID=A0A5N5NS80_9ROSI|nr:hypothetical protein DKX38_003486 [Salix brachista]
MDSQEPRKNHAPTPGHGSHGVHVCHKCGWPFPNPHPSARRKRAHKKICGTLEGYKIVDSEETSLSALSDDDSVSDEDPETPSPKVLVSSSNEKGSVGIGDISNRSEDEVFTDAVTEFPESGYSSVTGEHTRDVKEQEIDQEFNKATAQTSRDGSIAVTSPRPSNSADPIRMQSTEAPVCNLYGKAQESLDHDSNSTIGFMTRPLTDCRDEESGFEHSHDNEGSACDSIPVKLETQTKASQEKKKIGAGKDLAETDAKGHKGAKFDAGEASEMVSKFQKMEDVTSEPAPTAEFVKLKEGHADVLASGMSLNDLSPEVKSDEPVDSSVDAAQTKGGDDQEMDSTDYVNSTERYDYKGEGDENVHVLIVPRDFPVVADAENLVKGFKDHEGGKLPQLMNVDSSEVFNNVKDSDAKDNPSGFNLRPLTKDTKVSTSDLHVLDDNLEPKGVVSQLIVEEFPDEAEDADPLKSEVGVTDVVVGDLKKSISVQSPEEVPCDHCETSSLTSYLEHAINAISVTNTPVVPMDAEVRNLGDTGNHDKDKIVSSEIAVNVKNKKNAVENCAENRIPTSGHAGIPSEQVDQGNSVLGDVNAAAHEEGKMERCNVSKIETEGDSVSGLGEENLLREPKATPESAVNFEYHFTSENEINVCGVKLSEHEHIDLGRVLELQDSRKAPESNSMANLQEHAGKVSSAADSDGRGDVEVLWKSSEDKMVREPLVSPPEISPSLQNPSPIAVSHARDFLAVASGKTSDFFPDEGDNNLVTQQVVASATDFSVDSSSQTDSLEGHWGSVSVLSTQSDIPTTLDAEPLPSSGYQALAEKATSKMLRAASETKHADKSDVFEAPSFMTLVEPRDGIDQKAAASETQTTQNPQQPKAASLQAGWFPSITNVVNESPGRKKNEKMMAKVMNWSTGKQHPLLMSPQHAPSITLSSEASMKTKPKSPDAMGIPVDKVDPAANGNGTSPKTASRVLVPQEPVGEPVKDGEKTHKFPAADIKREKKKVKGRPYWAQFGCCSSVNEDS